MEGRGRPGHSGSLDGDGRRSIYLSVRRNFLNPMLLAFDTPVPFSTMGRRNVSNVPAQALTLLNDPLVKTQSQFWAERQAARSGQSVRERLDGLYLTCPRSTTLRSRSLRQPQFPRRLDPGTSSAEVRGPEPRVEAWADLCHVLINMKEFIFVN